MADFLTRLIERSRDLAPQGQHGQRVEPLIAPLYTVGPNTALPDGALEEVMLDGVMDEELVSTTEPDSQRQVPAPHIAETLPGQQPEENVSVPKSSQHHDRSMIRASQALAEETHDARLNPQSGIEPLPPTPASKLPPARLVNARPGLTDPDDQSRRANQEPLTIRPRVARVDESDSTTRNGPANEAARQIANSDMGDKAAPVIRVTIGRIDVRAVTQAAPPARRATPPEPKLTLEEYLRSRNGGKR